MFFIANTTTPSDSEVMSFVLAFIIVVLFFSIVVFFGRRAEKKNEKILQPFMDKWVQDMCTKKKYLICTYNPATCTLVGKDKKGEKHDISPYEVKIVEEVATVT